MYRIKLKSGHEVEYKTIDELAAGVQAGVVTPEAEIYHARADRWLAITAHPHYQTAMSRPVPPGTPAVDPGRRQVMPAITVDRNGSPQAAAPATRGQVPPTAVRSQLEDAAQMLAQSQSRPPAVPPLRRAVTPRRPAPPSPEPSPLRAHENVVEGVTPARPSNGNGHGSSPSISASRPGLNGSGRRPSLSHGATQAFPVRVPDAHPRSSSEPPAPEPVKETPVPDLDNGFELADTPTVAPPADTAKQPEPEGSESPVPAVAAAPAPVAPASTQASAPPEVHEAKIVSTPPVDESALRPIHIRRSNNRMALIAAAAVLVVGVSIVAWRPWKSRTGSGEVTTSSSARTPALASSAPAGQAGSEAAAGPGADSLNPIRLPESAMRMPPTTPTEPARDSSPAIVSVAAPTLNARAMEVKPGEMPAAATAAAGVTVSPSDLLRGYSAAYDQAQSELKLAFLRMGFTQVFAPSRLTSAATLRDTRRLIGSARNAIREYRADETRIERAYQDTVGPAGRKLNWSIREFGVWNARPLLQESDETAKLAALMLSQADSLVGLLMAQDGNYDLSGGRIVFKDAAAARQYGLLRTWLSQQSDQWGGAADAGPVTVRHILQAIQSSRLPQEKVGS